MLVFSQSVHQNKQMNKTNNTPVQTTASILSAEKDLEILNPNYHYLNSFQSYSLLT